MASQRQIEANRRNGSKGGPKTEAGKATSRVNSTKHGLTAATITVMRDETQEEYDEILSGFRNSFQPADAMEDALVVRLAQAEWRTLRSRHVETEMLEISADMERAYAHKIIPNCPPNLSAHGALAASFLKNPEERWKTYMRYDGAISREFFRSFEALTRLQKERKKSEGPRQQKKAPLVMAAGASGPVNQQVSENGIRSVSQDGQNSVSPSEEKEFQTESTLSATQPPGSGQTAGASPSDKPYFFTNYLHSANTSPVDPAIQSTVSVFPRVNHDEGPD